MTLWSAAIGGTLIGLAAVWLYAAIGRIAGISGIAARAFNGLRGSQGRTLWPWLFTLGLGLGGWLAYALVGTRPTVTMTGEHSIYLLVGGLLVGVGTRLGSGCTSGHGVCGISRFSLRSTTATITFVLVGMLTATGLSWL